MSTDMRDMKNVRHMIEGFQAKDGPRPSAILSTFLSQMFGFDFEQVESATLETNSDVDGLHIKLSDGRHLVVLEATDFCSVNDVLAPYSVTHRDEESYVAFVEKPGPSEGFFLGDMPNMIDGTLICGDFQDILKHIRTYFSEETTSEQSFSE